MQTDQGLVKGRFSWRIFSALMVASLFGVLAVLPYVFALFGKIIAGRPLPMPLPVLIGVQALETIVFSGVIAGVGLILAPKVGIRMPLLWRWLAHEQIGAAPPIIRVASLTGAATGAAIVFVVLAIIAPRVPAWPIGAEASVAVWKRLLACFYGGINEELLMHLFLLGIVLWLLQKISRRAPAGRQMFWIANVIVAILFGAGHLPAASLIMPVTSFTISMIVLMNGTASLVFGYLTWTRGIEAAMIAHFVADVVMHIGGPLFVKA